VAGQGRNPIDRTLCKGEGYRNSDGLADNMLMSVDFSPMNLSRAKEERQTNDPFGAADGLNPKWARLVMPGLFPCARGLSAWSAYLPST
jgi:hypothetical protein